jgi:transposase
MEPKVRKPRPRRLYTDEFKAGAVALVMKEGRSLSGVANDLDLTPSALERWVRQARVGPAKGPAGSLTMTEKEELVRLRSEVHRLQMERDILKKAAAFFAKETT